MKESFLHYLWQYQLFTKSNILTTTKESVSVQKVGIHNSNSGPDFLEAKLQIGGQLWAGSVEIHLKSSDWYVHNHETDSSYDNVILHVVWEDDMPVFRKNNTPISTLELKGLVPKHIWDNYQDLFQKNNRWIACEDSIAKVDSFTWNNWLERLYIERLERKSIEIEKILQVSVNDWEAVLFQLLAKNFGLKVNGKSFLSMAESFDYAIIRKERGKANHLEALLMGQAGVLAEDKDEVYYNELQKIYQYQQHKYRLSTSLVEVQFFRLRPPNFPSIRIAQLANLFSNKENLFDVLMHSSDIDAYYSILQTQASRYWDTHYVFGKEAKKSIKRTTKFFIDLLIINTIIPLRFTYQKHIGKQDVETLFRIMQELKPEKNNIISKYSALGIKVKNAMDSQALLTLKNEYCQPLQCLECTVGLVVLKE